MVNRHSLGMAVYDRHGASGFQGMKFESGSTATELACFAHAWIRECILILFIAPIETGEILLNQECKCPGASETDIFGNPDLIRNAPVVRLVGRD
jgi:hypothetical protein